MYTEFSVYMLTADARKLKGGNKMETRRATEYMAFDHVFTTENGEELCHATGYEVLIDDIWWNEYEDSEGNLYYGN